ncbi:5-formyltetrahydrofolate cyclo-ligase [Defluviimonas sp. WL0002]|uniref:5-formyltetrahydrofolate cyclo-ligase n=1 Tax=Albidovulum marisflavi TaxID=2984159 RepID=A0ABT2ZAH3_9RHOB|nr:5-formyltetrahydrofolate cyclo-ligase [Defluviimonas sp. WL0002]MCV2868106.1 5-formyltetrahydrofolate cyclo-ligase [Defluviimonas sp. WL0002]
MTLTEIKREARAEAFARRKAAFAARSPDDGDRLTGVLAEHVGKTLAGYMPMRTEIDCMPSMAAHRGPVGVPVILGAGRPLKFRQWHPHANMVAGEFGAFIPETGDWVEPEVLIVPLLSFDRRGFRLGYGGGFYDRTLEGLRAKGPVTAIGFAFAAQEVDEVPIEATDQPLDLIVTESEVFVPSR